MLQRILAIGIVIAVIGVGGTFILRSLNDASQKPPVKYRVTQVELGTVKKTVTATGTLQAWKTVDIKSRAGGRLINLAVDEGMRVKRGQLIAQIDPSDTLLTYNSARADIDSNRAKVDETRKTLTLQQKQTLVAVETAEANLHASEASANAAKARYLSAKEQADAQSSLTESSIDNAQATLDAEKEHLRQLKSASHPQATANAKAALGEADANLKNAAAQLNRQKSLLAKGFVAQSQVDQAEATYEVAKASYDSAKEKMDTMEPELDTDLRAQQARVNQAEAALKNAQANRVQIRLRKQDADTANAQYQQALAEVKQAAAHLDETKSGSLNDAIRRTQIAQAQASGARAQASLTNADIQLKDTRVTAPSDGIILKKYVEQGTLITSGISFNSTGTSIVQMGDTSRMYVDVQVDETDVANVDEGQKVDVTMDAYPTSPVDGKVIKIEPQAVIDQNVTTVHVRVEVDNSATLFRLLKPGMNATCEFIVDKKTDVVQVPNEALHADTDGSRYVEIAEGGKEAPADKDSEPDPKVLVGVKSVKRPVEIGVEGNESTEIKTGVKEGDRIVTQTIEPTAPTTGGSTQRSPFGSGPGPGRR